MRVIIHRVPLGELPTSPAVLSVHPASAVGSVAERLRQPVIEALAGPPLVILMRVTVVNTPDLVELVAAGRAGNRFDFTVDVDQFTGIVGANVRSHVVIEAAVGALQAGSYECVAVVRPSAERVAASFTVTGASPEPLR